MLTISYSRFTTACFILLSLLVLGPDVGATGIQDVAPTAADAPVMLETGRPGFGVFADFDGPEDGRLVVSIGRADEVLYIGLAPEYRDSGNPFTSLNFSRYRFRIRQITSDGTNPVVHGPFTIDNSNANVNSYEEAAFGTYEVGAQQFGDSIFLFRPGVVGDFSIEFDESTNDGSSRVAIPFWDFTVVRDGAPVVGRLWSKGWAFRTPQVSGDIEPDCVWDRQFNGDLYSYTEDGFVSRINFNGSGLQGLSFNIAFNQTGPGTSGDLAADRQSIPGVNATGSAAQHRIFLNLPDIELFPDGICGTVNAGESFLCGDVDPYCLNVEVTRPGQVDILLDFNGNGILDDNSQDVALIYEFTAGDLSTCVPWNGLRGDSTPVDFTDTVDVIISYSQGIQHWSAYDVEFMRNGFCVETVRPTCGEVISSDDLYWDDRNIPQDPGTGAPKDNRSGNGCNDVPRTWDNFILNSDQCDDFDDDLTEGYGDKNTLNTWWVANSVSQFRARVPVVSAIITGPTSLCAGDTSVLVAMDQVLEGEIAYDWSGPGVDTATTPSIRVFESGEYCVAISDSEGCASETCVTVTVLDFEVDQFPGILQVCFGDTATLAEPANPDFTYSWTPSTGISSTNSNDPVFFPEETTVYTATITGPSTNGQVCEVIEQITVTIFPEIGLQVFGGGPICDETTTITATTLSPAEIVLVGPDGNTIGTGTEFTVPVSGEADYTIIATNVQGCVDSAVFTVSGGPVNISLPDTVLTCLSDGVNLSVTNLDANDTLTYAWTPANLFTAESVNTANPVFNGEQGDYTVNVVVTNQYGCSVSEDVQLIVIDDAGVLSFEPVVDCNGTTVTFDNTSTVSFGYVWDFGDGETSNETSPAHVYSSIGTFTVTLDLIYDQTCVASVTQEVTTFPILVDAAMSIAFGDCDNGSASLTFTDQSFNATGAPLTYDWTFTGTIPTTGSTANPTVLVTESGEVTATLVVSSADGCTSTVDSTFTVELAVVSLVEEVTICPGESTELNPGGNPDLIYSWSPAPDFAPTAVNPTTGEAGTYVVTVTSTSADFNCENTDTITVIIPDSIGLVVSGPNGPLSGDGGGTIELPTLQTCGDPVDLTVDLMTNDDVDITYTDLDGNVLGTGSTFTANPSGRDTIVVTAVNEFGCIERDTVVIINNQVDASIDVGADGLSFCSATDTSITVLNFDPIDELTFAWDPNAIITGPLDGATVDITSPIEGSVDLSVLVSNQFGCDTTITVTVEAVPFIPNIFPDTVLSCFGEDFTVDGGDAIEGYIYEWTPSAGLDLSNPASPMGNFTEDTELIVLITDPATGCSSMDSVLIDVAPEIAFAVDPAETNICGTGIVTIEGTSVNDNVVITWYNDQELTDVAGTGSEFTINADMMGQSYTVFGEAVDTITGCSQMLPATVNTTTFTPNQYPELIMPCFGDPFTIVGGDAVDGYVYEWAPSDNLDLSDPANPIGTWTEDGTVSVTITDPATGCTETQNITVDVAPEISFMASPTDTTICEPAMITVDGSSVNENVEIVWYEDEELTTEIGQGATIVIDASETGQSYTIYGQATDPTTGCQQIIPVTVNVSELTAGLPLENVPTCFGETPPIFGANGPSGDLEYSYEPANVIDNSDPSNPVFVGSESTNITVTVTDPATGCSTEVVVMVDVTDITGLEGSASDPEIFVGENSTLTVTGCDDCTYEWFPQDGTVTPVTGSSTVTATPDEPGTYIYEVEVSKNGCMEVVEIELRVEDPICDPENIYVPNVFTPNGDNMNDVMRVRSKFADQITEFRFIIHNRWGQEVYASDDINDSWDGTSEGDDLEPDVYGYWLRVVCPAGEELIQQGNITILR